jgi:hypothetical protein
MEMKDWHNLFFKLFSSYTPWKDNKMKDNASKEEEVERKELQFYNSWSI